MRHFIVGLTAGLTLVAASGVSRAADITLIEDTRRVLAEGYARNDTEEVVENVFSDEETADFGAPFMGSASISGTSPDGVAIVMAEGTQESSITFSTVNSFDVVEINVNAMLDVENDDNITGDIAPGSVEARAEALIDLTLHSEEPLRFELTGRMMTEGADGTMEFEGFGVDEETGPQGFAVIDLDSTGRLPAGTHRLRARADAFAFFTQVEDHTEVQFTLRAVAIPEPATGVVMALLTAGVLGLRRRPSGGRVHVRH